MQKRARTTRADNEEEEAVAELCAAEAALAALGVASVNAATIIETYPLTADCSVSNTSRAERICFSFASRAVVASRKASRRDTDFHCDPR